MKSVIEIEVADQQSDYPVDLASLSRAARTVLQAEGFQQALLSIAVVDDTTIHHLNNRYLAHDYPTDVLSFVLAVEPRLEGEIVVSAQTAADAASRYGWALEDELLLYVVHGTLHLAGYDDQTAEGEAEMRAKERHYLRQLGRSLAVGEVPGFGRAIVVPTPPEGGET